MAKQLYDYWFVQFDFPDENGQPYKSSGGKMKIEKGKIIPCDWQHVPFNEIMEIKSGFPFNSDSYLDCKGNYKIITIKNVQDHELNLSSTEQINNLPTKLPNYCKLEIFDCLISLTGNVGRICRVHQKNLLLNQRVGKIISKTNFREWVCRIFDDPYVFKQIQGLANGCAQSNVSPIDIGNLYVIKPTDKIIASYNEIVEPITSMIVCNNRNISVLTEQRDELLPLLMNGQAAITQR